MGKMMVAIMILLAIELSMSLFISCVPGEGVSCEEKTFFFDLLLNPQDWSVNNLVDWIKSNILYLGGAATIVAGLTIFTKIEFAIYMGLAAVFFSFGKTLFALWQQISLISFFGDAGPMVASILVGGIIIYFFLAVLDYARGRD